MNIKNQTTNGSLKVSQEVLATIAKMAADEIDGIYSLAANHLPKTIGKKGITIKPVYTAIVDDAAIIDISVIVLAGYKLNSVAEELQKAVKEAVQTMTGITVSKVNVHIEGIHFPQNEKEELAEI